MGNFTPRTATIGPITSPQWLAFIVALEERFDISLPAGRFSPGQDIESVVALIMKSLEASGRPTTPLIATEALKQVLQTEFGADVNQITAKMRICDLPSSV